MIYITSDPKTVQKKAGFDFLESLLQPTQCHDRRPPLPLLLSQENGREYLLVREIEAGNMQQLNCSIPVLYYHPYFLLEDKWRQMVPVDLSTAIKNKFDNQRVCVDGGIAYATYEHLANEFQVEVARGEVSPFAQAEVYTTSCQEVCSRFYHKQTLVDQIAAVLAQGMDQADEIGALIGQGGSDRRFSILDEAMTEEGIDTVIASSPLAVMELAGYPASGIEAPNILAVYNQGEEEITVLSSNRTVSRALVQLGFRQLGDITLSQLIKGKTVGFEEDSLDVSTFLLLTSNCRLQKASTMLRRWREAKMNSKDLAYFVITATASRYAIEKTLSYAEKRVHQALDLTEIELFRLYNDLVKEFTKEKQIPVPIRIYFTNLHAGSRSLYPAVPADYPVNKEGKTYKLDAGLMVLDGPGLIHACSDVARTMVLTTEGREIYDFMQKCIREGTLPAVKPGKMFKDVYWTGIKQLADFQGEAQRLGMLPEGFVFETDYQRDIGHLLERQEAFTATFCHDKDNVLKEYMLGCIEYQWPYKGHSIAFEEMFLVTNQGGLCLTAGED